jgi:hypothetical protein
MREFTKAAGSFFLAMSLFGVKQMENIVTPRERGRRKGPATQALDSVTAATLEQLGDGLVAVFRAADTTQRAVVGLWFNMFLPFLSNYGSASSREVAWERKGERSRPPRDESLEDIAKAAMEEEDKSWREDIVFHPDTNPPA